MDRFTDYLSSLEQSLRYANVAEYFLKNFAPGFTLEDLLAEYDENIVDASQATEVGFYKITLDTNILYASKVVTPRWFVFKADAGDGSYGIIQADTIASDVPDNPIADEVRRMLPTAALKPGAIVNIRLQLTPGKGFYPFMLEFLVRLMYMKVERLIYKSRAESVLLMPGKASPDYPNFGGHMLVHFISLFKLTHYWINKKKKLFISLMKTKPDRLTFSISYLSGK
jgi:hypothetical protein